MRIWTNKNGDYKFNQHKEGMEPRIMIGDFTDILLTNIQQADLPNVSSLSPKSGFMIPGVEQEISHLCPYLWTTRTAKNFANVLFTELCLFDLRFQFRKNVYQEADQDIEWFNSFSWFDVYLVNIHIETSNDHLSQLPITSAITPADFLWTDRDLGNLDSEGNVYVCKSLYLE